MACLLPWDSIDFKNALGETFLDKDDFVFLSYVASMLDTLAMLPELGDKDRKVMIEPVQAQLKMVFLILIKQHLRDNLKPAWFFIKDGVAESKLSGMNEKCEKHAWKMLVYDNERVILSTHLVSAFQGGPEDSSEAIALWETLLRTFLCFVCIECICTKCFRGTFRPIRCWLDGWNRKNDRFLQSPSSCGVSYVAFLHLRSWWCRFMQ